MARPAYSALLAAADSVSDPQALGGPPTGSLWVIRDVAFTVGSYLGFIQGFLTLNNEDPRLLSVGSGTGEYIGVKTTTFTWSGRVVVPAGSILWAGVDNGDAGDFYVSGYVLTAN